MSGKSGLMSSADKKKLDEFSAVSNESGKFMGADGKWATPKDDDSWAAEHLTITGGANGLDVKRMSGAVEFTIPIATSLGAGVMSSADKVRLDALNAGTVEHTHSGSATLTFTTVSTDTCAIAINRVE